MDKAPQDFLLTMRAFNQVVSPQPPHFKYTLAEFKAILLTFYQPSDPRVEAAMNAYNGGPAEPLPSIEVDAHLLRDFRQAAEDADLSSCAYPAFFIASLCSINPNLSAAVYAALIEGYSV